MNLIIISLLFLPLGQLGRLTLYGQQFLVNDVLVAIVVLSYFYKERNNISRPLLRDPLWGILATWVIVEVFSFLLNSYGLTSAQLFGSGLHVIRYAMYAGLYFVARGLSGNQRKKIHGILIAVFLSISLAGLIQYIFLPDVSFLARLDWDDHYYRLVSTFLDPGFTGAILAVGIFYTYLHKGESWQIRLICLIIFYIALALTYSRASYAMFLAGIAVISIYHKNVKIFLVSLLILLLTIQILPSPGGSGTKLGREYSIWSRVNNWKQSIVIWQKSPIWGVGFNNYRYSLQDLGILDERGVEKSHGVGADSSILLVLATTGILGLVAFLNLQWRLLVLNKKNVLYLACFAGFFVHSWFDNTLFYPFAMEILWIFAAFGSSLTEKE